MSYYLFTIHLYVLSLIFLTSDKSGRKCPYFLTFSPADGIIILTYIFGRRRSLEVHHPHNDVPYFLFTCITIPISIPGIHRICSLLIPGTPPWPLWIGLSRICTLLHLTSNQINNIASNTSPIAAPIRISNTVSLMILCHFVLGPLLFMLVHLPYRLSGFLFLVSQISNSYTIQLIHDLCSLLCG